jgi:acyl-coenzyme A thioesterase PaaI-like protein
MPVRDSGLVSKSLSPTTGSPTEGLDPETPLSVLRRFGIVTLEQNMTDFTVVAAMPLRGLVNPFTGHASLAGLAVLVDDVAGRVNYYRRGRGQWTVSSELTVEITPGAVASVAAEPDEPVIASAQPLGPVGPTLISVCTLTHAGTVIGGGTVHTVPLSGGPEEPLRRGDDQLVRTAETTLAELMAAEPMVSDGSDYRMVQRPDPMVNNLIGIVHGGVSSAGLEIVASAAVNHGQAEPLRTGSIRVNFLRPFFSSAGVGAESVCAESVYVGSALRVGRTAAVGDARAIGPDGKSAVIARVTAYR